MKGRHVKVVDNSIRVILRIFLVLMVSFIGGQASAQTSCPSGMIMDAAGTGCIAECPDGQGPNSAGDQCEECAVDEWSINGQACQSCPTNSTSTAGSASCECAGASGRGIAHYQRDNSCVSCGSISGFVSAYALSDDGRTCVQCPAGMAPGFGYLDGSLSQNCIPCPAGHAGLVDFNNPEFGTDCAPCTAGTYKANAGVGLCQACDGMTTAGSIDRQTTTAGNVACAPCPDGETGRNGVCVADSNCPPNMEPDGSGGCQACPNNEVSPDGLECVACLATTIITVVTVSINGVDVHQCGCADDGLYLQRGLSNCGPCSTDADDQVVISQDGLRCLLACPDGQQIDEAGTQCEFCPEGQVTSPLGRCEFCGDGEELVNGRCETCPSGEFSTEGSPCRACPSDGTLNSAGSGCDCPAMHGHDLSTNACVLVQCPLGEGPNAAGTACEACGAGEASIPDPADGTLSLGCERCTGNRYATETDGTGSCEVCGGVVTRDASTGNNTACTPCTGNTASSDGLTCRDCGSNGEANSAGTACVCLAGSGSDGAGGCIACTGNLFSSNGLCEPCTGGMVPSESRTGCISCEDGKNPNETGSACVCGENEIENESGVCELCPSGQVPDGMLTSCIYECSDGTTALPALGEVCESLCTGEGEDYDVTTKRCVACKDTEFYDITMPAGSRCETCTGGQRLNADGTGCECRMGEVLSSSGSCTLICETGMIPNLTNDGCECPMGEVENADGVCELSCGTDKEANSDNTGCECRSGLTETVSGYCLDTEMTCRIGMMLNDAGDGCGCPLDHREDGGRCILSCTGEKIPNAFGDACRCPEGQFDAGGDRCIVHCTGGRLLLSDNTCACPTGFTDDGGGVCILSCPSGKVANADNTLCRCPAGQEEDSTGACALRCEAGKIRDVSSNTCACPGGLVENVNGICITTALGCSGGKLPNAGNTSCICPLGLTEGSDGECGLACLGGKLANEANTECQCPNGQIENANGICELDCPHNQVPSSNNSACECPMGEIDGVQTQLVLNVNGVCISPTLNCTGGKVEDPLLNACVCPLGQEEDPNGQCSSECFGGKVRNAATRGCECPSGYEETESGRCDVICPGMNQIRNAASNTCQCPEGYTLNASGDCIYDCINGHVPTASGNGCECPSGTSEDRNGACILECTGGKIRTGVSSCACPTGMVEDEASGTCVVNCTGGKIRTGTSCTCPGTLEESLDGTTCIAPITGCPVDLSTYEISGYRLCVTPLPSASGSYTSGACESSGWESDTVRDIHNRIAERCLIPHLVIPSSSAPNALSETTPNQLVLGGQGDACIIRGHTDYENNDNLPSCSELFGAGSSFPSQAEYREERVRIVLTESGEVNVMPPSLTTSHTEGKSDSNELLYSAGAVGILLLLWSASTGEVPVWSFTPEAEFRTDNGISYYSYGSRLDYTISNWAGYWQAAQSSSNGRKDEWIYGTGATWSGEIFGASMHNTTQGEDTDMTFSLSARKSSGVWTVSSSYTADLEIEELNRAWSNRLSLSATGIYDKWTVSPSANLSWEPDESFGKDAGFYLNLRREL